MKIQKKYQGAIPLNRIANEHNESELNTYSTQYLNSKFCAVSSTQPINGEEVWIQTGKNLFDRYHANILNAYIEGGTFAIKSHQYNKTLYIACEPNTQYTIQKYKGEVFTVGYTTKLPDIGVESYGGIFGTRAAYDGSIVSETFTTGEDAKFLVLRYYNSSSDTGLSEDEMLNSIQIEKGDMASNYESYVDKKVYIKNVLGTYDLLVKNRTHVGLCPPTNGEEVWMYRSSNLLNSYSLVPQNKNRATTTLTDSGFDFTFVTPLIGSGEGYYTNDILFKKGVTYTFHCESSEGVAIGNVRLSNGIGHIDDACQEWTRVTNGHDYIITPDQDYYCFRIWVSSSAGTSNGADTGSLFNMTITDEYYNGYEPYVEQQILVRHKDGGYRPFGVEQKHILCAYLSTETTKTTNADQRAKVPLDQYELVGNKLMFNPSKSAIVIGKGVKHISIKSGIAYKQPGTSNNRALDIAINGSSKKQKLETLYGSARTFGNIEMEMPIVEVKEGDVITLLLRTVAQTEQEVTIYDGMGCTYLCVEVID